MAPQVQGLLRSILLPQNNQGKAASSSLLRSRLHISDAPRFLLRRKKNEKYFLYCTTDATLHRPSPTMMSLLLAMCLSWLMCLKMCRLKGYRQTKYSRQSVWCSRFLTDVYTYASCAKCCCGWCLRFCIKSWYVIKYLTWERWLLSGAVNKWRLYD